MKYHNYILLNVCEFPPSLNAQVFLKPFLHQFKDSQYIKEKIELSSAFFFSFQS